MKLNFVVDISGNKVILSQEQLSVLWDIVHGADIPTEKWVGTGKGSCGDGNSYVPVINKFEAHKDLTVTTMSDEQVEAIKFCMKQKEQ